MSQEDPIKASVEWLKSRGFNDDEAKNICSAIRASSAEKLWEDAPQWIEWCGEVRRNYECIVDLAAKGIIRVELSDKGIEDLDGMTIQLKVNEDEA